MGTLLNKIKEYYRTKNVVLNNNSRIFAERVIDYIKKQVMKSAEHGQRSTMFRLEDLKKIGRVIEEINEETFCDCILVLLKTDKDYTDVKHVYIQEQKYNIDKILYVVVK